MKRREYLTKARTILEGEYRISRGLASDMPFDDRSLVESAIESKSCPPNCDKILLEQHKDQISVLRDGSNLFALCAVCCKEQFA